MFKRQKKLNIENVDIYLRITDRESFSIVESIGIKEEDLAYLKLFKSVVDKNIDKIVDEFYKPISENKELVDIINKHSSIEKLKRIIGMHINEMFHGRLDSDYINMRSKIAKIHMQIGLSISDYMSSFDALDKVLFNLLEEISHSDDRISILKSTIKILNLEKMLVISAYNEYSSKLEEELRIKSEQLNHQISESSTNLSSLSQQLNASLISITDTASHVASDLKKVVDTNDSVNNTIEEGKMSIELQRNAMSKLIKSSHHIISDLHNLKNMSLKIEEVIAVISEISTKTNLLALNAQIEASRGGSDGNNRAFGVIASQLRDLSDNVHKNVDHISNIINSILTTQSQLENTSTELSNVVDENEEALNETASKLRRVTESIHTSVGLTDNIDEQMTGLDETLKQLSEAFEVVVQEAEKLNELTLDLK